MTPERQTSLARFLVGNMYFRLIHLPRDDVSDEFCPICGYKLKKMHVIEECKSLEVENCRIKEAIPTELRWALSWLAWQVRGSLRKLF